MTYGEYKVWQKEHMEMRNGEIWFPDRAHDKRLMPNLAIVYYNRKLYDAWIEVGAIKRAKSAHGKIFGIWRRMLWTSCHLECKKLSVTCLRTDTSWDMRKE
ncbi:hypothetical protein [Hydrogenimonas sp.]